MEEHPSRYKIRDRLTSLLPLRTTIQLRTRSWLRLRMLHYRTDVLGNKSVKFVRHPILSLPGFISNKIASLRLYHSCWDAMPTIRHYRIPFPLRATIRAPGPACTPSVGPNLAILIRSLSNIAPMRSARICASSGVVLYTIARS